MLDARLYTILRADYAGLYEAQEEIVTKQRVSVPGEGGVDCLERFGPPPKSSSEKIAELRAEVDGLSGRIKEELLAVLRVEIERLISMHEAGSEPSSRSSS